MAMKRKIESNLLGQLLFADSLFLVFIRRYINKMFDKSKFVRLIGGEKPVLLSFESKNLYSNHSSYTYFDLKDKIYTGKTFKQQNIIEIRNIRLDTKTGIAYSEKNEYISDTSAWPSDYLIRSSQIRPPSFFIARMKRFDEGNYISLTSNGFYHWLIEDLPHFIFLLQTLGNPKVIVFENAPSYVLAALDELEVDYVKAPRFISLGTYFFIGKEDSVGWPHPKDINTLKDFAKDIVKGRVEGRRIYISRVGASRSPRFEPELINELIERGWQVVDTTYMPLKEQIEVLSSASVLAGFHGAGLSGMTWLETGSKVIELSNNRIVRCFERLSLLLNLQYHQIQYESPELSLEVSEIVSKMEDFSS